MGRSSLFAPRWIALHLAVLALAGACGWLGWWQLGRAHRFHGASAAEIASAAVAVPAESLMSSGAVSSTDQGRLVTISGTFDGSKQLLVPGTELGGANGYDVIAPLVVRGSTAVVINRGWQSDSTLPPAPQGKVSITGWISGSDPVDESSGSLKPGEIADVDIATLANRWPYVLESGYVVVLSQQPPATGALRPVPAPPQSLGHWNWNLQNLSYVAQWWAFGIIGVGWWISAMRRERNPETEQAVPADSEGAISPS